MANRLAGTLSPYLRAHADNPVDWYPWGGEAFAEARRREVPILLSIGYATCHWCHVMARESFSDPELAAHLNARFVPIKVDREENPEVDATYLAAAGAFTQQLGWPLTVFLTPDGRAFYAGTYYPPEPAPGSPSFRQVLDAVAQAWRDDRAHVFDIATTVVDALRASAAEHEKSRAASGPSAVRGRLADALESLVESEDVQYGGFGTAPKFPMMPAVGFLLEGIASSTRHRLGPSDRFNEDPEVRYSQLATAGTAVAERALAAMADSPLRDRVEGGFFRYATQRDWSVPHYERMLYDNAQLLAAYTDLRRASEPEATEHSWLRETAEGVADFLLNVLRRPSGGFGSAQDSESTVAGARSEGGYYSLDAQARAAEEPPTVDGKVLTGWNGLAVGTLADAGLVWSHPEWLDAARQTADLILSTHRDGAGRLARSSLDGVVAKAPATLEDYGLLARGLLHLALAGGGARYALAAKGLIDEILVGEGDGAEAAGHPFRAPAPRDPLLTAQSAPAFESDGSALPGGEAACAEAAQLLWETTGDRRYEKAAQDVVTAALAGAAARPLSSGTLLALATRRLVHDQVVIVTTGGEGAGSGGDRDLVEAALRLPGVHAVVSGEEARSLATAGFTLFEGRECRDGRDTVYACREFVCELPVTDVAQLRAPASSTAG